MIAQDRQQYAIRLDRLGWLPLHIEEACVPAGSPVLQHVPPPWVVRRDGHVVGHDVEHDSEPVRSGHGHQRGETLLAAELWIDPVRSHHVVAVRAPGHGLQDGREVQMADAELCQVWHDLARGREVELAVQLQPIRCPRHVVRDGHAAPLGGSVRSRTITHKPSTLSVEPPRIALRGS